MSQCKHYDAENGICKRLTSACEPMWDIVYCNHGPCPYEEPLTNYDRIKSMSVEKMAEAFAKDNYCQFCKLNEGQTCDNTSCKEGIMQYLESEVTTDEK